VCSSTGAGFIQSISEVVLKMFNQPRELERASHIMYINNIIDKNEIRDPREDTTFQVVKASG